MVCAVSPSAPDSGSSRPRYSSKAARMSLETVALSARVAKRIAILLERFPFSWIAPGEMGGSSNLVFDGFARVLQLFARALRSGGSAS